MNKRGMSGLITTVLIIGFTIIIASMVIMWGSKLFKGTIDDTQKTAEFSRLCTGVSFDATAKEDQDYQNTNQINVEIDNNVGTGVEGFLFTAKSADGTKIKNFYAAPGNLIEDKNQQNIYVTGVPISTLGSFSAKAYGLRGINDSEFASIDIRAVVKLENEVKICDYKQNTLITQQTSNAMTFRQLTLPENEPETDTTTDTQDDDSDNQDNPEIIPPSFGSIIFNTNPGEEVNIILDDENKGKTPTAGLSNIAVGEHILKLTLDGYQDYATSVIVNTGETKDLGTINLVQIFGNIKITASPTEVEVYLNNELKGKTDATTGILQINNIALKEYNLSLQKIGYENYTNTITVSNSETKEINILLNQLPEDACSILNRDVRLIYDFTDGSGLAIDKSGYGNNGILRDVNSGDSLTDPHPSGALWFSSGGPFNNGYYNFDGIDDILEVIPNTNFQPLSNVTYSLWMKSTNLGTDDIMMGDYDPYVGGGCVIRMRGDDNSRPAFICQKGGSVSSALATAQINNGNWHLVTGIANDTGIAVYVDGLYSGSVAKSGSINYQLGKNLTLGGNSRYYIPQMFNGSIANPRIFTKTLSYAEILSLNSGTC